jgi:hypothetical protein
MHAMVLCWKSLMGDRYPAHGPTLGLAEKTLMELSAVVVAVTPDTDSQ